MSIDSPNAAARERHRILAGHRHRRERGGVLLDRARGASADRGRQEIVVAVLDRAPDGYGIVPGRVVARVSGSRRPAADPSRSARVPHAAAAPRRVGRVERAYGLLVSGNYFSALGRRWDDFSLQRMSRIPVIRRSSSSLMSSGRRGSRAVLMRWDDRFESTAAKSPSLVSRRAAFTVRCRIWRSIPSCRSTI